MSKETDGLVYAFALGIPALLDFHLYSSYLSSPWTTQKLSKDDPDSIDAVWTLYWEATTAAFILAFLTGAALWWGTGSVIPMLIAMASFAFGAIWMGWDYSKACKGEL